MAYTSIQTNASSLFARNALNNTAGSLNTAVKRLSTGLKINGPEGDPAGYAINQRFTTQVNGVGQAIVNGQQANTLLQTATGAIQESTDIMQKIRTIAVQAANGSNSDGDRAALQNVVAQLKDQIQTIANQTQFNSKNLLDGSFDGEQFQVGANAYQVLSVSVGDARANKIGVYEVNKFQENSSATTNLGDAFNYGGGSNTISISGSAGQASLVASHSDSAKSIADSVNALTKETNVLAVARTQDEFYATSGTYKFDLANGTLGAPTNLVTIQANLTDAQDLSALVTAINQQAATTGISATSDGDVLTLVQAEGENIVFKNVPNGAGTGSLYLDSTFTGFSIGGSHNDAVVQGQVTFQSDSGFTVESSAELISNSSGANGIASGSAGQSVLTDVASIDISTTNGANQAIQIADFAIKYLNNENGRLGAQQERVTATLSNLATAKLNLTAARGAVQDADLAEETSTLVKNQILQQAGISSLAQANQLQQSFLKLLP